MRVLFFTGAGISANAGIPVYRQVGSSWTDKDLEQKSHANSYGNHLDELWDKHWGPLSNLAKTVEPTHTHKAITEFQKNHEAIVATQNIDGLHERAGNDNVVNLHGTMNARCLRCKHKDIGSWSGNGSPECSHCGSKRTRPDVVLFGEALNKKTTRAVEQFANASDTDYVIAIGTSLNVWPAAGLVMDNVSKSIIINKEPTVFDKWAKVAYNEDCDKVIDDVLEGLIG